MVTPAEGPSLLTPPAGKWMWMSVLSSGPHAMPYCKEGRGREGTRMENEGEGSQPEAKTQTLMNGSEHS